MFSFFAADCSFFRIELNYERFGAMAKSYLLMDSMFCFLTRHAFLCEKASNEYLP